MNSAALSICIYILNLVHISTRISMICTKLLNLSDELCIYSIMSYYFPKWFYNFICIRIPVVLYPCQNFILSHF